MAKLSLGLLTPPAYLGCSGAQTVFNNTWGHYAPQKNTSYKGFVRFFKPEHGEYGRQCIIIQYEFPNLSGPYIHNVLFNDICTWDEDQDLEDNVIYQRLLTFRNYRFYYGKIYKILDSLN